MHHETPRIGMPSPLTSDEYHSMADGLADSDAPATGTFGSATGSPSTDPSSDVATPTICAAISGRQVEGPEGWRRFGPVPEPTPGFETGCYGAMF